MHHLLLLTLLAYAQQPAADTLFESTIRPILERRCLGCHNEKLTLSNLSLATRAALEAGGKRGAVIGVAKPASSRLLQAVRHEGTVRMPPGVKLPDGEISVLERWIAGGAKWAALIRRVALDLTGIPPTPERIASFLKDQRTEAWQRLIDEYLNSPHHG